jgi:hypothetical protein
MGRRLIQRFPKDGSVLHQDSAATFILTLCRAAISHEGCDRGNDVRTNSGPCRRPDSHSHSVERLSKTALIVATSGVRCSVNLAQRPNFKVADATTPKARIAASLNDGMPF